MKIIAFHARVMKIMKIFRIPSENHAINENYKITRETHENQKIKNVNNEYHHNPTVNARITKIMKI